MKRDTTITHAGRYPRANHGIVNPPVYHTSTVLYPTLDAIEVAGVKREYGKTYYGISGTPTQFSFEEAVAKLENAHRCRAVCSGLAAITVPLLAFLKSGDHMLMADNVYGPARRFALGVLKRNGVETTFYNPTIGAEIANQFRPNTRVLFMESPGSLTFEMQDVPALVAAAKPRGIVTMIDNTWASPIYFKPLDFGVDVSIQAVTKYIAGHSDLIMGTIATNAACADTLDDTFRDFGMHASPDDCFLAMRGLKTIHVRMPRHAETGIKLARWLQQQPEVECILHPALPEDPGHKLWKRDMTGACGLFGVVLKPTPRHALAAMMNGFSLFGMGASWGGFESLIIPAHFTRSVTPWRHPGPTLRIHAGLEDPDDLQADLAAGFKRMRDAAKISAEES
jgi:cystathionine beta-lyase